MNKLIQRIFLSNYAYLSLFLAFLFAAFRLSPISVSPPLPTAFALLPFEWVIGWILLLSVARYTAKERLFLLRVQIASARARSDGTLDFASAEYVEWAQYLRELSGRRVALPRALLSEYLHFALCPAIVALAAVGALALCARGKVSDSWKAFLAANALFRGFAIVCVRFGRRIGKLRFSAAVVLSVAAQFYANIIVWRRARALSNFGETLAAAFGAWILAETVSKVGAAPPFRLLRTYFYAFLWR